MESFAIGTSWYPMVARFSRRHDAFRARAGLRPASSPGRGFARKYPGETLGVTPSGRRRRPWGHVVALEPRGQDRTGAEEPPGLGGREARKLRRLQECRAAI